MLLLLAALAGGWPALVPWSLGLLLAEYAVLLVADADELDPFAPLYAAGLLLAAELAFWAIDGASVRGEPGTLERRLVTLAVTAVGAAVLAALLIAAASVRTGGGAALELLGLIAAAAAAGVVAWLARRARPGAAMRASDRGGRRPPTRS